MDSKSAKLAQPIPSPTSQQQVEKSIVEVSFKNMKCSREK
jgi:hypothetical protein